ncbi:MAG: ABC transporter permease [Gemmatimonadetes bacterium]|nr:ABC transporter permease [Gemmatimonadota bacterium]
MGLEAELGRTFVTDIEAVETTEVVLSSRYWLSRFGGDPNVIGRSLQFNATPVVVVGVMSPDYVVFGENIDLWVSIKIDRGDQTNSGRWLMVVGRLTDGVAIETGGRVLSSLLFQVQPPDPIALGGAAMLLLAVALVACAVPAWRAARVAPSEALRAE